MNLLRVPAFLLFFLAMFACFGWGIHWGTDTLLGLLAAGLACFTLSFTDAPPPPSR